MPPLISGKASSKGGLPLKAVLVKGGKLIDISISPAPTLAGLERPAPGTTSILIVGSSLLTISARATDVANHCPCKPPAATLTVVISLQKR